MSCSRSLTISEGGTPPRLLYWTLEESGISDRVDSVIGLHAPTHAEFTAQNIGYSPNALGMDAAAGKFGNGCRIAKGPVNTWFLSNDRTTEARIALLANTALRQDGNGFSFCFWLKVNVWQPPAFDANTALEITYGNINFGFVALRRRGDDVTFVCQTNDTIGIGGHQEAIVIPEPTIGAWTFYELYHDPATAKMGVVINNTTDYPCSYAAVVNASPNGEFVNVQNLSTGAFYYTGDATDASDFILDEVLIRMDARLTVAQRAYLYNAGAGRTWPIALP